MVAFLGCSMITIKTRKQFELKMTEEHRVNSCLWRLLGGVTLEYSTMTVALVMAEGNVSGVDRWRIRSAFHSSREFRRKVFLWLKANGFAHSDKMYTVCICTIHTQK